MITIIDYDAGNIKSVEKACQYLGQDVKITRDRRASMAASHVILPGVGAFGDAMSHLKEYHLIQTIYDVVEKENTFSRNMPWTAALDPNGAMKAKG